MMSLMVHLVLGGVAILLRVGGESPMCLFVLCARVAFVSCLILRVIHYSKTSA